MSFVWLFVNPHRHHVLCCDRRPVNVISSVMLGDLLCERGKFLIYCQSKSEASSVAVVVASTSVPLSPAMVPHAASAEWNIEPVWPTKYRYLKTPKQNFFNAAVCWVDLTQAA